MPDDREFIGPTCDDLDPWRIRSYLRKPSKERKEWRVVRDCRLREHGSVSPDRSVAVDLLRNWGSTKEQIAHRLSGVHARDRVIQALERLIRTGCVSETTPGRYVLTDKGYGELYPGESLTPKTLTEMYHDETS